MKRQLVTNTSLRYIHILLQRIVNIKTDTLDGNPVEQE